MLKVRDFSMVSWLGTKNIFVSATMRQLSKSKEIVIGVQGALHSPNNAPTMVHGQAFQINT